MKRFLFALLLSFMMAFTSVSVIPMASSTTYVLNTNTKKFHRPNCSAVSQMKEKNRQDTTLSYDQVIEKGYVPCKNCNPSREDQAQSAVTAGAALKSSVVDAALVSQEKTAEIVYVVNTNTKKFHYPSCSSAGEIKEKNRKDTTESREQLIQKGYVPCKRCNP